MVRRLNLGIALDRNANSGPHRLHSPRHLARSQERVEQVANLDLLYRLRSSVRHPDRRARPDALQIMRAALPAALVAGVVEAGELDDGVCRQLPEALLAIVSVLVSDDLFEALNDAFGLGLLAADDQGALVARQHQASEQVGLASAGGAAVAGDVGLALVGHHLRPRKRGPGRRVRLQQGVDLGQLFRRRVAQELLDFRDGEVGHARSEPSGSSSSPSRREASRAVNAASLAALTVGSSWVTSSTWACTCTGMSLAASR